MISSIHIDGYRGFERFDMAGLGRLNLLVGTNNSGKTSLLEALYLLTSRGDPTALWQLLWRRGERMPGERGNRARTQIELDVSHLFTGHELQPASKFTLSAKNQNPERSITFAVSEMSAKQRADLFGPDDDGAIPSRLVLEIKGQPSPIVAALPLTRSGGILPDALESPRRIRQRSKDIPASQFITTESLSGDEMVGLWDKISLTPDEPLVLKALQFLDTGIERIAALAASQVFYGAFARGGFIVKKKGFDHPIPIGSMGDGMWRMLALIIAITQCKGGVLLIDEIDTGLHYTVMSDMWKLIFNTAKEFDVQVFATTHSYDCIQSLATICANRTEHARDRVTMQRIEVSKPKAIPYSEQEIKVAADRNIEVR